MVACLETITKTSVRYFYWRGIFRTCLESNTEGIHSALLNGVIDVANLSLEGIIKSKNLTFK